MDEEKKVLDTEIVVSMSNATYKGEVGPQGPQGEPGLSAYLVAVDNGFVGSQQEWLATLKGEKGETGLQGPKGEPGDSAYQVAVNNGFEGTEEEWLASIHTIIEGDTGKSAYEIAVDNGFVGTEVEWLASLKGIKGDTGDTGPQGETGPAGQDGATPVKGVDYFTEQDIEDFIAQVPQPDLSKYNKDIFLGDNEALTDEIYTILNTWNNAQNFTSLSYIPGYNLYLDNHYVFAVRKSNYYGLPELFYWDYDASTYSYYIMGAIPQYSSGKGRYYQCSASPSTSLYKYSISASTIRLKDEDKLASANSLPQQFAYIKENYATKAYVEEIVRGIETGALKRSVVQALPIENIDEDTIYMVSKTGSTGDIYNEYLYVDNTWELIGSTEVDLTNYATKNYVDGAVFSGNYNDLTNKPTIPSEYTLPTATTSSLGGVKVDGSTITINDGVISAVASGSGGSGRKIIWLTSGALEGKKDTYQNRYISSTTQIKNDIINNVQDLYDVVTHLSTWKENYQIFIDGGEVYKIQQSALDIAYKTFYVMTNRDESVSSSLCPITYEIAVTEDGLNTSVFAGGFAMTSSSLSGYAGSTTDIHSSNIFNLFYDTLFQDLNYINTNFARKTDITAVVPDAPTIDGAYKLTSTVASGSATYAWEEDTGSGSGSGFSGDYNDLTNKPTIPSAYTLPTATTSTLGGVKVDGETITITDGVISAVGGSSYTAGDGIDIDTNNIINVKNSYSGSYGINGIWSHWREKSNPVGGYMETETATSAEQAINYLLNGLVIDLSSNIVIDIRRVIDTQSSNGNYSVIVFDLQTKKITNKKTVRASNNYQYTLSYSNQYVKLDNYTLLELTNPTQATIRPSGLLPYFIIHQSPEYTTYNVAENLDEVMDTVNTRVPLAPTTDGNYVLKVSVSSGTPTYSWVEATIGGSY